MPGWDVPGFDASGWSAAREVEPPGGALFSQLMQPMKVVETRRPERLTAPRPDTYLFDFGQLFGGWVRIRLRGPAGTRVVIKHSSRLRPDGTIDDAAYPGAHESDTEFRAQDRPLVRHCTAQAGAWERPLRALLSTGLSTGMESEVVNRGLVEVVVGSRRAVGAVLVRDPAEQPSTTLAQGDSRAV